MSKIITPYMAIRDVQEKSGVWSFAKSDICLGTTERALKTGDYTIEGLEDIFTIERKASTGEISGNITEKRFENELNRMDAMTHSFLICEFTLEDIFSFPFNSGIPSRFWPKLKVTSNYIVKRLVEIETDHKVKIIFAGKRGPEYAEAIFKRMMKLYG